MTHAATGPHQLVIAHVERQARNISIDNVEKIAVALGVAVYEMLKPQARVDCRPVGTTAIRAVRRSSLRAVSTG